MVNNIMMSVDMDEWYQCRWATGSPYAIWPDTAACFRAYYNDIKPKGEIIPLTERVLELFAYKSIEATFFFTGEIAGYYPGLVKMISSLGHEIGSHNYVHKDYNSGNMKEFKDNLHRSKVILEDLCGSAVIGYRAPNSTVSPYMIACLLEEGFLYDSSVTPTRPFLGKFGNFSRAPRKPYILSNEDYAREGNSGLWEFPWPVFPVLSWPAGSGIMSRIAGYRYTLLALEDALKHGDSVYYFHPYEIGPRPSLPRESLPIKLFLRNLGEPYLKMLHRLLRRYRGRFISGRLLYQKVTDPGSIDTGGDGRG